MVKGGRTTKGHDRESRNTPTMDRPALTSKIGDLVDLMRSEDERRISMKDIASITEVLITTMEKYFSSIDTSIYREFDALSTRIATMRQEVSGADSKEIQDDKIPRAGKELDEVVKATEDATNIIMTAAEDIMSGDTSDVAAYQTMVNDACMKIFEACSFQDITGQRVTKVIDTLTFIESRIGTILEAWGDDVDFDEVSEKTSKTKDDELPLNGPALAGEGVNQDDVDAMFALENDAPASPTDAELLNDPALAGEGVDQDDVDAMFASDDPSETSAAAEPSTESPAPDSPAPKAAVAEAPAPATEAPAPGAPAAEAPAPEAEAPSGPEQEPKPAAPAPATPSADAAPPLAAATASEPATEKTDEKAS